jgi:hypothetical protein
MQQKIHKCRKQAAYDISIVTTVAKRVVMEIRKLFSVNRYLTNRPFYGTSAVTSQEGGMCDKRGVQRFSLS